jgi:hypothetical protein
MVSAVVFAITLVASAGAVEIDLAKFKSESDAGVLGKQVFFKLNPASKLVGSGAALRDKTVHSCALDPILFFTKFDKPPFFCFTSVFSERVD